MAKNKITAPAPAKLNLFLEVLGRREDGYHELSTLMVTANLCDEMRFERADAVSLRCGHAGVPAGAENTVLRVIAAAERETGRSLPCAVDLIKHIPPGAGLGGGSSDAATALRALDTIYEMRLEDPVALRILASVGSDTAFFWRGGAAVCTGRGEIVRPVDLPWPGSFVILLPRHTVSTPQVYAALSDSSPSYDAPRDVNALIDACRNGAGLEDLESLIYNRLSDPAFEVCPDLLQVRAEAETITGRRAHLTGSGAAFFMLCESREEAEHLAAMLAISHIDARAADLMAARPD